MKLNSVTYSSRVAKGTGVSLQPAEDEQMPIHRMFIFDEISRNPYLNWAAWHYYRLNYEAYQARNRVIFAQSIGRAKRTLQT